jgi:hypothetical protein
MPASRGEFRIDTRDLGKLIRDVKRFDPALATALRRNIRIAAKDAADAVKQAVLAGPTSGRKDTGLRAGIAAGVKVQVATGAKLNGVYIRATSTRLPAGQAKLVRAYNKPTFRHPVYGRGKWVDQPGHPYFDRPILDREPVVRIAIEKAIDEAIAAIK